MSISNNLNDCEFTGEVKIEEGENEKEIQTMVMDKDQNNVDEKTEVKMEDVSKPLVSYEIRDKVETEMILVKLNLKIKFRKKILISDFSNF